MGASTLLKIEQGGEACDLRNYGYDAMEHLTSRTVKQWSTGENSVSDEYVNNRRVGWQYDADGRMVGSVDNTYDAAGRHVSLETSNPLGSGGFTYDGNGQLIKSEETAWDEETQAYVTQTAYSVRSSALGGQVLTELSGGPRSFVYAGLAVLASRDHDYGSTFVQFEHRDPSGASVRMTSGLEQELDPTGADAGTYAQSFIPDEGAFAPQGSSYNFADPTMTTFHRLRGWHAAPKDGPNGRRSRRQRSLSIFPRAKIFRPASRRATLPRRRRSI